jgi:hypothetical protein
MIAWGVRVLTPPRNLTTDRDDSRLDPLGLRQKLMSDVQIRAVGADQEIGRGRRPLGEARNHPSVRAILEGNELLAETSDVVEPVEMSCALIRT